MTCIDAAIIKALVEHIGMNPDDVPVQGGGSEDPTNIFDTTKYTKIDNGSIDTDSYSITNVNNDLKVGDIMVVKFDPEFYPNMNPIRAIITDISSTNIILTSINSKTNKTSIINFEYDDDKNVYSCSDISKNNCYAALDETTGFFATDLTSNSTIVKEYERRNIMERLLELESGYIRLRNKIDENHENA